MQEKYQEFQELQLVGCWAAAQFLSAALYRLLKISRDLTYAAEI